MLSPQEIEEINADLSHYEDNQAVCIDALKIVQKHRGWVSDECVEAIADYLKISAAAVEGVATFYNLIYREPVGKKVIRVCDSVSCWVMGYETVRDRLKSELGIEYGETTADGEFTLLPGPCMGACDHAPVVMVDNDLHEDVDESKVKAIVEHYKP
ncbi:MAG: NADH-quinone oxidoreductase subunit NuoE [Halieaceae bacterium]|nr:NADH-quinone oxidoreductase subunit NuoE [Halieaceae bacterium]